VQVVHSARYHIDIGPHVFPTQKYRLVHDRLKEAAVIRPGDVVEPQPAAWDELALVHTGEYLTKIREGALSREELAQLQLPWSPEMVEGFRLMTGGTIDAACLPLVIQEAAGLPLEPSFAEQKAIMLRCNGLFYACKDGAEARRFNRLLIDAGLIHGL